VSFNRVYSFFPPKIKYLFILPNQQLNANLKIFPKSWGLLRCFYPLKFSLFYASKDDLLQRIRLSEWEQLVGFIVDSVRQTVVLANQGAWPEAKPGFQIDLRGIWFQISSQGSHHDVHTHGNCSWSGVYCLQVDAPELRSTHPVLGEANGVTRFYGPHFNRLGGAAMDFGNAYLQNAHLDVEPVPGQLVVFPSWLAHQAMPYHGTADRVIVSFNVSLHAAGGSDQLHGYAHV
jgi:uncharacterized protein (TIGR02466 family)